MQVSIFTLTSVLTDVNEVFDRICTPHIRERLKEENVSPLILSVIFRNFSHDLYLQSMMKA